MTLEKKYKKFKNILNQYPKLLVAYSGGVDSTFLLKVAADTIGTDHVTACIANGPSLPQSQYEQATKLAREMNVEIITIKTNEMTDPKFLYNKTDRCYYCKSHLFECLKKIAKNRELHIVACGHNFDDISDYRPGNIAAKDYSIAMPLMEAKLTKTDIRKLSKQLALPTADIPASPCLASRIPYNQKINPEKLKQVEDSEEFLKTLGLVEFRVRHHGDLAKIEVHISDMKLVINNREKIVEKIKSFGFKFIALDMAGFQSGSLNKAVSQKDKDRFSMKENDDAKS